jgi:uncharacterized protein YkwD
MGRLCSTILLFMALMVAAPSVLSAETSAAEPPESAREARMLARINVHRVRLGLVPLEFNARLAAAARAHAADMAARDYFSHDGPDGTGFESRATQAGYRWRAVAENLAGGQFTAKATVDGWMTSEGHRQNLLNPTFRHAGIGYIFRAPDGGEVRYRHYWALTLGVNQGR